MAKNLPAEADFDEHARDDLTEVGDALVYDGESGLIKLNRDQNWLLAYRTKHHVSETYPIGTATNGLRENSAGYTDRLEFRVTPQPYVSNLRIRINGGSDGNGDVRVTTPLANIAFNFAAAFAAGGEQTGIVGITAAAAPAAILVVVALRLNAGTYIDLRRLLIRDEYLALAGMP